VEIEGNDLQVAAQQGQQTDADIELVHDCQERAAGPVRVADLQPVDRETG
jgi:hypothetical protein